MSNASQFTKRLFWIVIPFPLMMWRQSTWSKLPGVLRKSWKVTPSIRMFEGAVVEPLAVLICEPFETYWPGPQPAEPPNTETFDALVMNTLPVAVRFRNVTKLAPWFTYQPAVVATGTASPSSDLPSPPPLVGRVTRDVEGMETEPESGDEPVTPAGEPPLVAGVAAGACGSVPARAGEAGGGLSLGVAAGGGL